MPNKTEVKITINSDDATPAKSGANKKHRRGTHIGVREDEILSRRKVASGIKFYDLGSEKTGDVFITRSNAYLASVALNAGHTLDVGALTLANYNSLISDILADGQSHLSANNRQINPEDGASFRITAELFSGSGSEVFVSDSNSQWTAKDGLRLTQAQMADLNQGVSIQASKTDASGANVQWSLALGFDAAASGLKVTKLPSFGSPSVPSLSQLRNGDRVYLMPQLNLHSGNASGAHTAREPLDGNGYGTIDTVTHSLIYRIIPRDFSNHNARFNGHIIAGNTADPNWTEPRNRTSALSPMRTFIVRRHHLFMVSDTWELTTGSFPFTDWGSVYNQDTDMQVPVTPNDSIGFAPQSLSDAGLLIGIVQRGSEYYYFWNNP